MLTLDSMLSLGLQPLTVVLALASGDLSSPVDPSPIVGGEPVTAGAHPEVVFIRRGAFRCTGTLLTPNFVFTAAHCFGDGSVDPSGLQVLRGDSEDAPDEVLEVADYGMHPDFCNPIDDSECAQRQDIADFAWIRLQTDASIAADDLPVVVTDEALHHELVRTGAPLRLVGYGEDESGQIGLKRQVDVTLTSFTPSGHELVAGSNGKDSCQGDSGGPAYAVMDDGRMALVGVLSRGGECGEGGVYGATLAGLCWARDDSGIDVGLGGCGDCSCVDLTPRAEEDEGCGGCRSSGQQGGWGALALMLLVLGRRRLAPTVRPR